jgi:hypothetical protein
MSRSWERGVAELDVTPRSHAPAWECIRELEYSTTAEISAACRCGIHSHAGAWERDVAVDARCRGAGYNSSFPRSRVGMHTKVGVLRCRNQCGLPVRYTLPRRSVGTRGYIQLQLPYAFPRGSVGTRCYIQPRRLAPALGRGTVQGRRAFKTSPPPVGVFKPHYIVFSQI